MSGKDGKYYLVAGLFWAFVGLFCWPLIALDYIREWLLRVSPAYQAYVNAHFVPKYRDEFTEIAPLLTCAVIMFFVYLVIGITFYLIK